MKKEGGRHKAVRQEESLNDRRSQEREDDRDIDEEDGLRALFAWLDVAAVCNTSTANAAMVRD